MTTKLARFGDPREFEIAVRWKTDEEPRDRRPAGYGWSMGDLMITVGGVIVTGHRLGTVHPQSAPREKKAGPLRNCVTWYLAPFFDWLATNWIALIHEERYDWSERVAGPAIAVCRQELGLLIDATDTAGASKYRKAQKWVRRHALREAAAGGLFPDLFLRRWRDDIEISWTNATPPFAPDAFAFEFLPGVARMPVAAVARPLWNALQWCANDTPPEILDAADKSSWLELCEKIGAVEKLTQEDFDAIYADRKIIDQVRLALEKLGRIDLVAEGVEPDAPFVAAFAPAVAMFGGVTPSLTPADVSSLCGLLATRSGEEKPRLAALARENEGLPLGIPYANGYQFAEEFLEEIEFSPDQDRVDIRGIVDDLGIEVVDRKLDSDKIRGAALAGDGFSPTILINSSSAFNANEAGKRFTIAHELCHVLYDRSRARRVTHISGAWTRAGIERRANAFAAYVLMPRSLVARALGSFNGEAERIADLAKALEVNVSALVPHLFNLELIDAEQRERLRSLA